MSLTAMLPLLRCPRSGSALRRDGERLLSETGEHYPIVDGKPILVRQIQPMHVDVPGEALISRTFEEFELGDGGQPPELLALNLGCGNVPCRDPRVISMDVLPTEAADLVAEAEALPFRDEIFDRVVSGAVFEHLFDPLQAVSEVRRVVKPGGKLHIDTAFMQSYHGFPSHYFNLTPQAIETFLADDFILEESGVPSGVAMQTSLLDLIDRVLEGLPSHQRRELLDLPLDAALARLRDDRSLFATASEFLQRATAASFYVVARKPADYHAGRARNVETLGENAWRQLKSRYYQERTAVMLRHHEIWFYRMRLTEDLGRQPAARIEAEPELSDLLRSGHIADPLNVGNWQSATAVLQQHEVMLRNLRDQWIHAYLSTRETTPEPDIVKPIDKTATIAALHRSLADRDREIAIIRASSSWQFTAPLRAFGRLLGRR